MTDGEIAIVIQKLDSDEFNFIMRVLGKRKITAEECWEFQGKLSDAGYGLAKYKGVRVSVHRTFFKLLKPLEFREDLMACHSCNNRRCFNLTHIYMGTARDNYNDAVEAGTSALRSRESFETCSMGHLYTYTKTGVKRCQICYKEYQKQYRSKKLVESLIASILSKNIKK